MVNAVISDNRQKPWWKEMTDRVFCLFHISAEKSDAAETDQQRKKRESLCKYPQAFAQVRRETWVWACD